MRALGWAAGPDWLPIRTLYLLPALVDQFDYRLRHRHIVELLGHLCAVVIGPVEEIQRLARDIGLGLLLVHQDEARPGDRPAVFARLVGEQQVEILSLG